MSTPHPGPEDLPDYATRACHRSWLMGLREVAPDPNQIQKPTVVGGKAVIPPAAQPQIVHVPSMTPCIGPQCHMWSEGDAACLEIVAATLDVELKRSQLAMLAAKAQAAATPDGDDA